MNDSNSMEYVVAEKAEGKKRLIKILGRAGLLTVISVFVILCFALNLIWFAIIPMAFLGVVLYFWKSFNVDLSYSIETGVMTFSRTHVGMRPKKILDVTIKDMKEIAPATDETAAHLTELGVDKVYMFASSSTAYDKYYATFEQDGHMCVVYFEATEKALKILRYYNAATVVTKVAR